MVFSHLWLFITYLYLELILCSSEDEARMKIYSVSTRHYFAFGALVSEELSYKLKGNDNYMKFSVCSLFMVTTNDLVLKLMTIIIIFRVAKGSLGSS